MADPSVLRDFALLKNFFPQGVSARPLPIKNMNAVLKIILLPVWIIFAVFGVDILE
jgi:hypothetical protein